MPNAAASVRDDPTAEASATTTIILFSAILPAISPKCDTSLRDKHPGNAL
jgi:hypothetical protein